MKVTNRQSILATQKIAQRARQRGISIVQVAVVILVGAILILGGLGAFRYVTSAQMNNDAQDFQQWSIKTKDIGLTQGAGFFTTTPTIDVLKSLGFFNGSTATTTGGKSAVVTSVAVAGATTNNGLQVVVGGYTAKECTELVNKIVGVVTTLMVNSTEFTIGTSTASAACNATGNGNSVTARFAM